jgi:hypothetical protein
MSARRYAGDLQPNPINLSIEEMRLVELYYLFLLEPVAVYKEQILVIGEIAGEHIVW